MNLTFWLIINIKILFLIIIWTFSNNKRPPDIATYKCFSSLWDSVFTDITPRWPFCELWADVSQHFVIKSANIWIHNERCLLSLSFSDPLLFVNVDISDCYDSIDSKKLYGIMEQVLMTPARCSVCVFVTMFQVWIASIPHCLLDHVVIFQDLSSSTSIHVIQTL